MRTHSNPVEVKYCHELQVVSYEIITKIATEDPQYILELMQMWSQQRGHKFQGNSFTETEFIFKLTLDYCVNMESILSNPRDEKISTLYYTHIMPTVFAFLNRLLRHEEFREHCLSILSHPMVPQNPELKVMFTNALSLQTNL